MRDPLMLPAYPMASTLRLSLVSLCLALLAGCAAAPGVKSDPRDPWERMNRTTYRFNDALDRTIAKPVARGYRRVTPHFVQTGVGNFLDNLGSPVVMVNDLLQGEFRAFASDTGRLLMNTTLGIGGLLDPATAAGLDKNDRDFGQTLGKWGVRTGPYLVIPFLGPSDIRDAVGRVGDVYSDPRHYIRSNWLSWGLWGVGAVNTRARLLDADATIAGAYDPYAFIRTAYLQHREYKVHGGQSTGEEDQEQKMLEEAGEDQGTQAAPAPAQPATPPPAQSTSPH
ncbi:MAG TPA: VacJ family lipoprotein [Steroidobacteraceae bacterium]|jgi:phospholipid-binding lipoprotein MlaA